MLSQRLKSAHKRLKLTQEDLAAKVNTTKSTISNYENGYSTPLNKMLVLLSNTLDVSTDYLLGKSESLSTPNVVKVA
ncbi:transcriptional regulator with XRE-family HTH domain [Sporosarcina luteola]|nr:transcriptional regulator with XRE-family HTH domain [Sporosarcina luteola]